MSEKISRRTFVKAGVAGVGAVVATGCQPKVVEKIVKETVVVEKEKQVKEIVKETVVVEKEKVVEKAVEKEVTRVVAPPKEKVVLRLHMRAGGETSEAPIYVTRPKEFTEKTGIEVKLEPIPGGEYMAKIEILAVSNTLGDATFTTQASWHHSRMVHFAILLPLDDFMASEKVSRDEWIPSGIDSCTFGGKVYGLPKTAHPAEAYVWVNHHLFEQAGLPLPPTEGMTWDQLAELAGKLAKGPKERRDVYGFYPVVNNSQAVINGIRSFGGWELDEGGKEAPVDTWKDYIKWNYRALVTDKVSPHASELGAAGIYGMFAAEKLALMQGGCWYYKSTKEAVADKFKWSIVGLPEGPKFNKWGASLNTHAPTMQSQHKLEAFKLQYALADARFSQIIAKELGYLVGRTKEMEEIGELSKDPFLQLQWKAHFKAAPYRIGRNYRGEEFRALLTNTLDEAYVGGKTPDDAWFGHVKEVLDEMLSRPVS